MFKHNLCYIKQIKNASHGSGCGRRSFKAEARLLYQVNLCEICDGQRRIQTGFCPSISFSSVSIPTILDVVLSKKTNNRCLVTLHEQMSFRKPDTTGYKRTSHKATARQVLHQKATRKTPVSTS
jgi:hypothetical protein